MYQRALCVPVGRSVGRLQQTTVYIYIRINILYAVYVYDASPYVLISYGSSLSRECAQSSAHTAAARRSCDREMYHLYTRNRFGPKMRISYTLCPRTPGV